MIFLASFDNRLSPNKCQRIVCVSSEYCITYTPKNLREAHQNLETYKTAHFSKRQKEIFFQKQNPPLEISILSGG